MPATGKSGIHFKNPYELVPVCTPATALNAYDSGGNARTSATTNFYTELARRGITDTTDWTANTYKTLLNVTSGGGLVAAIIGCTAGGVETTTFELTIDGVLKEITVAGLASGERAALLAAYIDSADYTTAGDLVQSGTEALDADKATFGAIRGADYVPTWRALRGIPLLKFDRTLLVRAKHSASITNSTATSYSAVMYRSLLAA